MADVVLCKHQKNDFFSQDVTVKEDYFAEDLPCPESGSKDILITVSYSYNCIA
jgi:hypothetical protein